MPINLDKPHLWKADIAQSVDMYNEWFMRFAPETFRQTRITATTTVQAALEATDYLRKVTAENIRANPSVLSTLRMATFPPIAVDRLVGLSGVKKPLVEKLEEGVLPRKLSVSKLDIELGKIIDILARLADPDIFVWLAEGRAETPSEVYRAATIVADRLCGSRANPIIRNAQETRQLAAIGDWLRERGYRELPKTERCVFDKMEPGTFSFRLNVKGLKEDGKETNIPVDAVIMPLNASVGELPQLIEAKSAGDYTNVNKRRKEEATKMAHLRRAYEDRVKLTLFLCGYFNAGYLGYGAADQIDWVWEHRIDDFKKLGI